MSLKGKFILLPNQLSAGDTVNLQVTYICGEQSLKEAEGIYLEFPTCWFIGTKTQNELGDKYSNFYYRTFTYNRYFQKDDPQGRGYVKVHCENGKSPNIKFSISIISYPWEEDPFRKENALGWEMSTGIFIKLCQGRLPPESRIKIEIKRVTAPIICGRHFIKVAVVTSNGVSSEIKWAKPIPVEINPSKRGPYEEEIFCKSWLKKGEKPEVKFITFDRFANPVSIKKCKAIRNTQETEKEIDVKWFVIKGQKKKNYKRGFLPEDSEYKLFWGDIHSHSEMSGHAYGEPEQVIRYARDISHLDFYVQIDHLHNITVQAREMTRDLMERYNKPGKFITFHGYEYQCKLQGPNDTIPGNHYNIYFRDIEDWFLPEKNKKIFLNGLTIEELLEQMQKRLLNEKSIIVAHQLGEKCSQITWNRGNNPFEPIVEIYSHHGTSEYYNSEGPLFYNNVHHIERENPNHHAMKGPHYVRDAWKAGRRLGVIASSDSHIGKPGVNSWGLTAVYAEKLDRKSIFEAILKRRTYATTGERIILYITADNHFMGEEFSTSKDEVEIKGKIIGTEEIEFAELIKLDVERKRYTTFKRFKPGTDYGRHVEFSFTDYLKSKSQIYYLKAKQKNRVRGRPVMAWSSPIWVNKC